jgi:acid phosphatase type 7
MGFVLCQLTYRYSADYGMFRFCVADSEHDWCEGTEQHKFIENCLATVDRKKQPWLIFIAHRVLGYSSGFFYAKSGLFEEPMGRESLQNLWQKYRVDMAFYGHVHNYERTCPIYEVLLLPKQRKRFFSRAPIVMHPEFLCRNNARVQRNRITQAP